MSSSKSLLTPYRTVGLFLDENAPHLFSMGKKDFLLTSTSHSFKLFKLPEMKIKLLGPNLPKKIRAITAHNDNILIASGNLLYHFELYHLVNVIEKTTDKITCMINVGEIVIIGTRKGEIIGFDFTNPHNEICHFEVDFVPKKILHPPTYLNKILIMGDKNLELRNIRTNKQIFNFTDENTKLFSYLQPSNDITSEEKDIEKNHQTKIFLSIKESPALDIIALGISNGDILIYNLKSDKILNLFQVKGTRPISLAFSQNDIPMLAVGDQNGDITIFNLNEKNILKIIRSAHKSSINFLEFLKEELILMSGSFDDNNLLMWQYDELEDNLFRIIRRRNGLSYPVKKLMFFGDEGHHVIASSISPDSEIKDYFLWNEAFEGNFSMKKNKSLKKRNMDTENLKELAQIIDFSISTNRALDWSNLLTCHKNFDKPYFWSSEDHLLIKLDAKLETSSVHTVQITKVFVTNCGNFGILGYENGYIIKINMQSGNQQAIFHQKPKIIKGKSENENKEDIHSHPISGLFVDLYNKVLVSSDSQFLVVNWDFFTADYLNVINTYPNKIISIKNSRTSDIFSIALDNFQIVLYNQYTFVKARNLQGHKAKVTDMSFTVDNKFLISASLDCTLKVWDIINGSIINNLRIKAPIISLDFDPSGDFLVTATSNSKELNIWSNKIGRDVNGDAEEIKIEFVSELKQKEWGHSRKKYFNGKGITKKEEAIVEENDLKDLKNFLIMNSEIKGEKNTSVKLYEEDIKKWIPLINLDEIKEKNKPKSKVETNPSAPFYLEFDSKISDLNSKMNPILPEEKKSATLSKIIRNNERNEFLDEVGSLLEKNIIELQTNRSQIQFEKVYNQMKKLSPSQLDYELRKATFGNIEIVKTLMDLFKYLFKTPTQYDIKHIFFNNFLNICSEYIIDDLEIIEDIEKLKETIKAQWKNLNEKITSNSCMIEHFAKIKN